MENTKRIVVLLILSFLTVGPAQSAEKPARRISNTRTASCLVKITCDPAIMPLSLDTIDYLLRSSGVGGKAVREVLDSSTIWIEDLFSVEYVQSSTSDASPPRWGSPGIPTALAESMDEMPAYENEMMETRPGRTYTDRRGRSSSILGRRPSFSETRSPYSTDLVRRTEPAGSGSSPALSASSADEQSNLFSLSVPAR
ncbi:MAG: hypothetical protein ABIF19_04005 [Planctomycetota bacterium]